MGVTISNKTKWATEFEFMSFPCTIKCYSCWGGVVLHDFNATIRRQRPANVLVPGQPGLRSETLSQNSVYIRICLGWTDTSKAQSDLESEQ